MAEGIRTVTEPPILRPISAGPVDRVDQPSGSTRNGLVGAQDQPDRALSASPARPHGISTTGSLAPLVDGELGLIGTSLTDDLDGPPDPADGPSLLSLLARRRSIRRLRSGPFPESTQARLHEAVRLTPAAFNVASTHVVFVHAERAAFWRTVETGFRERLEGDRLERYLDRLDGFRPGVGAALIFEDTSARSALVDAWSITDDQALAFAEQGLGMVQFALWLALTAEGLVTSLQHWEWLLADRIADFTNLPQERFRLAAILPIGYPDEPPRTVEPIALERVISRDRYRG